MGGREPSVAPTEEREFRGRRPESAAERKGLGGHGWRKPAWQCLLPTALRGNGCPPRAPRGRGLLPRTARWAPPAWCRPNGAWLGASPPGGEASADGAGTRRATVRLPPGEPSWGRQCAQEDPPGPARGRGLSWARAAPSPSSGVSITQETCPQGMAVPRRGRTCVLALRSFPAVDRGLAPPSSGAAPGGWLLTSTGKRAFLGLVTRA